MRELNLETLVLKSGKHHGPDHGFCIMEAVAYIAEEEWTDRPACACRALSAFFRSWNDGIPDDARRTELLRPFIPRLIGTHSTPKVEQRRAALAYDWLVRTYTPAFLELVPELQAHATTLRNLPTLDTTNAALPVALLASVKQVARSLDWAKYPDSAALAWTTTRAAAGAAAIAAAHYRDLAVSLDVLEAVAWAASWATVYVATVVAATDEILLLQTARTLQTSALDLAERMFAVS